MRGLWIVVRMAELVYEAIVMPIEGLSYKLCRMLHNKEYPYSERPKSTYFNNMITALPITFFNVLYVYFIN